jgi:trk system potassium uptake protein TrkA
LGETDIMCGDALDPEILNEANIQKAEIVISVTDDDKVNILASLLAKENGAKRSLTLLNKMAYAPLVSSLGVDAVINPRSITVSSILQHVRQGRIQSVYSLGDGYGEIIEAEARETSHIIGLTIEDISIRGSIMIAALERGGKVTFMPQKMVINVGDRLVIVTKKEVVSKVEKLFSIRPSYL